MLLVSGTMISVSPLLSKKFALEKAFILKQEKCCLEGGGGRSRKTGVVLLISFLSNNRGKKKGMGCFMNICFVKRVCA